MYGCFTAATGNATPARSATEGDHAPAHMTTSDADIVLSSPVVGDVYVTSVLADSDSDADSGDVADAVVAVAVAVGGTACDGNGVSETTLACSMKLAPAAIDFLANVSIANVGFALP